MPTGYTHKVQNGEVTDFADFAIECARGMGALVMLRDQSDGEPIPDVLPSSGGYHVDAMRHAKVRLKELDLMTPADIAHAAAEANDKALKKHTERRERRSAERARYEAMIAKVESWQPPSPDHVEFKTFMMDQLQTSLEFDTGGDLEEWDKAPTRLTPDAWHAAEVAKAHKDIAYHVEELEKARVRDAGRQAWWDALRASLPRPPLT